MASQRKYKSKSFEQKRTWVYERNIYLLNWIIHLYLPKYFVEKCVIPNLN